MCLLTTHSLLLLLSCLHVINVIDLLTFHSSTQPTAIHVAKLEFRFITKLGANSWSVEKKLAKTTTVPATARKSIRNNCVRSACPFPHGESVHGYCIYMMPTIKYVFLNCNKLTEWVLSTLRAVHGVCALAGVYHNVYKYVYKKKN